MTCNESWPEGGIGELDKCILYHRFQSMYDNIDLLAILCTLYLHINIYFDFGLTLDVNT